MGNAITAPALIRIFVASPDDVGPERDMLERMIRDLNAAYDIVPNPPLKLELRRWESVYPSAGRPQDVIFKQIGAYDIFIGLMWRRFGTPTKKGRSGTEIEYRKAREKCPYIMFYFSTAAAPPPKTVAEAKQLMQVVQFRERIREQQLIGEYDGTRDFESVVRPHLLAVLRIFAQKVGKQRQHHDRVLDQGRRGLMEAVRIGTARPKKGNGTAAKGEPLLTRNKRNKRRKEGGQWHKQPQKQPRSRKRPPQRRSS